MILEQMNLRFVYSKRMEIKTQHEATVTGNTTDCQTFRVHYDFRCANETLLWSMELSGRQTERDLKRAGIPDERRVAKCWQR